MSDSAAWAVLSERAVGQFPISIPTSLAIESLVGILPEAPTDSPEIKRRDLLMVNVRTLVRNLIGSIETEKRKVLEIPVVAQVLVNEIRTIESVIAEHSDGRMQAQFYHCTYDDLMREFSRGLLKFPNTPNQKWQLGMELAIGSMLAKEMASATAVSTYTRNFPDNNSQAVIITHYPIDLLQRYRFASLALLESHTGMVKHPLLWNTKLYNGKEFEIIPFDRMTIQMFGDGVTFSPMPLKIRQRVYSIAKKKGWTPATTKEYVIRSIEENRDPALEVLVKDLYRN